MDEIHEKAQRTSLAALETLVKGHCEGIAVEFTARPGIPLNVVLEEASRFSADLNRYGRQRP